MDEGYELDLTYVTERIIAVSFPRTCSEEIYLHNLKDVTRMLKSKHADNYLIINLSEKRHDLSKMNPKTLDTGWPDLHAPPLDKICTICKAMEGWLNADPLHVVVIHCRGGKNRIGVVISSFVHFTDISASADQALDRFAMRKYYDDKVSALMTPSQKRYVWILNSLLSGSMKMNASPLFLHYIILHRIPNFNTAGVCRPYLKVYQGMQAVYSSGVYHIGPGHRDRICISLEPAQLLKGDIMVKCYHKSDVTSEREVIFRLQFHTGAVQGYNLMFEKEDMETANKEPRFPDYGKVELVFSEGPEKIPGAERWQNGADVSVDYNTADPLTRWDSYQNINDGEVPRSQGLAQDKAALSKRSANGGGSTNMTLCRGAHRATSITSSPDHSDHALSASSDSGLSSTSLWTDRPPAPITTSTRSQQGPSRQEKAQLKRLLSGFGLEEPSREVEEMSECGGGGPGGVAFQRLVQVQVHVVGDPRPPRERETDILDDLVLLSGHDLHSVDSLGTLSSSCHKSSQNSLLSDGFGSPGGEELQHQHHHPAPAAMEEYERAYAEARRGCLGQRSASISASTPASTVPMPKQQVYLQGSYSTHTWVRQQQMVAAHQYAYLQAEEGEERERYPGNNKQQEGSPPKPPAPTVPQQSSVLRMDTAVQRTVMALPETHSEQSPAVVNKNKRDEEFNSLTVDIDNSIDQLNQLIMDLDPTFMPVPTRSSSVKRNGGTGTHVNGSATTTTTTSTGCPNGVSHRLMDNSTAPLQSTQQSAVPSSIGDVRVDAMQSLSRQVSDVTDHPGFCGSGWGVQEDYRSTRTYSPCAPHSQHGMLYRSDSVDYRAQGSEMDSGVEAGSDMTPPTPAFPISPPTPYVKNMPEFPHLRQSPSPSMQSFGAYRMDQEPHGYLEMIGHLPQSTVEGLPDSSSSSHRSFGSSRSAFTSGTLQRTDSPSMGQPWPEDRALLSRHASLSTCPTPRHLPPHSMSLDYGHHSPPMHPHPAPNAHSSPRGSQRSHMARYALTHSPAHSFDEQDDSGLGSYGTVDCPVSASPLLGNGGMERGMLMSGSMDQQGTIRTQQHQQLQAQGALPPLLPEKRRASDGEHSLGTASPAPSGFSSPHSGSSLSIPFPNVLPDLSASAQMLDIASPLPDVLAIKQVTVKFVQDTSKFWYKPDISRDQAISVLKDKEPGCFIVRDSHSFRGAYGLAMKVATPPPSALQQTKRGGDLSNELVRHFLIECTQKGVRLKGCPNEPYFGSLTALVCQHSITPLALPCKLIIPDRDPLEDMVENTTTQSITNSAAELLKQGAACNVWFLGSVEMESLTGYQAVQKATSVTLGSDPLGSDPLPTSTVVHFKVSSQGITLTDNQRKLFFRRHYAVNTVIFCALDPQDRKWKKDGCTSAKIFGFVARKTGSGQDNVCHLFAEHDPEQPASAIVNFVSKVMIGSQKTK